MLYTERSEQVDNIYTLLFLFLFEHKNVDNISDSLTLFNLYPVDHELHDNSRCS